MSQNPAAKPKVRIVFCEGCKWALRSGWYAQELFSTFNGQLSAVELAVGDQGQFQIWVEYPGDQAGQRIWCRKENEGFPEAADLKRRLRDVINSDASLGHCDLVSS